MFKGAGGTDHVRLESVPPGATVQLQPGGREVTTPVTVELARSVFVHQLVFSHPGYDRYTVVMFMQVSGWVFGNILNLGIGYPMDIYTDAMWSVPTDEISVELRPEHSSD